MKIKFFLLPILLMSMDVCAQATDIFGTLRTGMSSLSKVLAAKIKRNAPNIANNSNEYTKDSLIKAVAEKDISKIHDILPHIIDNLLLNLDRDLIFCTLTTLYNYRDEPWQNRHNKIATLTSSEITTIKQLLSEIELEGDSGNVHMIFQRILTRKKLFKRLHQFEDEYSKEAKETEKTRQFLEKLENLDSEKRNKLLYVLNNPDMDE